MIVKQRPHAPDVWDVTVNDVRLIVTVNGNKYLCTCGQFYYSTTDFGPLVAYKWPCHHIDAVRNRINQDYAEGKHDTEYTDHTPDQYGPSDDDEDYPNGEDEDGGN